MELNIKKISSLEKARKFEEKYIAECDKVELFGCEHYAYQLLVSTRF